MKIDVFTQLKFREVVNKVARYYGLPAEELLGKRRDRGLIEARFVAMYLCARLGRRISRQDAARFFGRHHSMILYVDRAVSDWRDVDPEFRQRLETAAGLVARVDGAEQVLDLKMKFDS